MQKSILLKTVLTDTCKKKGIIFEPNDPSEEAIHISYTELHQQFKMANVFDQGYKGDRCICILTNDSRISYCNFGMCQNWSHPLVVFGVFSLGQPPE
jgi:acetyl-CoA synthetase